ncbi:MAG: hypothetical protein KZQ83_14830 [gamma proteobacterium symbiont of Taylorina sp.]|nr:hypothetical protein [gamma proteobacterium symbiont of Taylorina sp.]
MKYTILINQQAVVNAGLHNETDLNDWAILEYIHGWLCHPKATINDGYVWINYAFLLKEMPLLIVKSKSSLAGRIKKLTKLNLIDTWQDEDGRIFIKTLDLYYQSVQFSDDNTPFAQTNTPFAQTNTPVRLDEHTINYKGSNYKNKRSLSKKINFSDDDMKLSKFIYKKLLELNPNKPVPNFEKWADTIRLMRDRDKLTHKKIQNVFLFANNDELWRVNILSPSKLRDKFDALETKMRNPPRQRIMVSEADIKKYAKPGDSRDKAISRAQEAMP